MPAVSLNIYIHQFHADVALVRETVQNSLDAHEDGLPPVIAVWSPREVARILLLLPLRRLDRGDGPLSSA